LEIAESDALRQRGGTAGAPLLSATEGQTNSRYAPSTRPPTPPGMRQCIAALLDGADTQVASSPVRSAAGRLNGDQLAGPAYENLNRSLLAIADAVPN